MELPALDAGTYLTASITHKGPCYFAGRPAWVNGLLYFHCREYVVALNPATNKEVARYKGFWKLTQGGGMISIPEMQVLNDDAGGVWAQAYSELVPTVRRIDIASGKITARLSGELIGAGDGMVYLRSQDGLSIARYSGATGAKLAWDGVDVFAFPAGPGQAYYYQEMACGRLLASYYDFDLAKTRVTVEGWPTSVEVPGDLFEVLELGDGCWANFGDALGSHFLERIGSSGFDAQSPLIPADLTALDGRLWMTRWLETDDSYILQRINTATWQPEGPVWLLPNDCGNVRAAGSIAWCNAGYRLNLTFDGSAPTE
jgi:hypothetical protein